MGVDVGAIARTKPIRPFAAMPARTIMGMALQDDLEALNSAIALGVRQVVIAGESTLFNTTESLIKARNDVQARINAEQARTAARRPSPITLLQYRGRGYNDGGY
jgi:hypothetical protein